MQTHRSPGWIGGQTLRTHLQTSPQNEKPYLWALLKTTNNKRGGRCSRAESDPGDWLDGCCSCHRADKFLSQLHANPTFFSTGSDAVECWDGCCSLDRQQIINSIPTQPCLVLDRMLLSASVDAVFALACKQPARACRLKKKSQKL